MAQLVEQLQDEIRGEEAYVTFSRKWEQYLLVKYGMLERGKGKLAEGWKGADKQHQRPCREDIWRIHGKATALYQAMGRHPQIAQTLEEKILKLLKRLLDEEQHEVNDPMNFCREKGSRLKERNADSEKPDGRRG